jgi:hypothetical protein
MATRFRHYSDSFQRISHFEAWPRPLCDLRSLSTPSGVAYGNLSALSAFEPDVYDPNFTLTGYPVAMFPLGAQPFKYRNGLCVGVFIRIFPRVYVVGSRRFLDRCQTGQAQLSIFCFQGRCRLPAANSA